MKTITIKNLRGLKDTGNIELCPITMLVGKNSSGKSTFLRTFPLFKQGGLFNKQGPILWYGPEVDFGSFQDAVRKGENQMEFTFYWESLPIPQWYPFLDMEKLDNVSCHMIISGDSDESYVKELHITIGGNQKIDLVFNKETISVYINGVIPEEKFFVTSKDFRMGFMLPIVRIDFNKAVERHSYSDYVVPFIKDTLGKITSFKTKITKFERLVHVSNIASKETMLQEILKIYNIPPSLDLLMNENWIRYNNGRIMMVLDDILSIVDRALSGEFRNVYYIKPFRATAERYYRKQNLAVKSLDSDGHNMAMLVNDMYKSSPIKKKFQTWTKSNFGFLLDAKSIEGHVSLLIKDSDTIDWCNITDKGFGYSQILPVILVLWQILTGAQKNKEKDDYTVFVAIEQPELHLHPKMQAQLMDAIIAVSKSALKSGVDIKFIIETHSQTMINRLGARIALKEYDSKNASVLLFNENVDNNNPQRAEYNNAGVLTNWPIGFFNSDMDNAI